jgi:hypothetical protein
MSASVMDELHEKAMSRAGYDDFGDSTYHHGLRVLIEAFETDVDLRGPSRKFVYDEILRILIARLHTQKGWFEHPNVLSIPIDRPLIIVGLPRTGTTALHRLLSMDQQFQGLEAWLSGTPMIRPPRVTWKDHLAYRAYADYLEARCASTPELRMAHQFAADEVDECGHILRQSFVHESWTSYLPTYARWYHSQDERGSYQRYVRVLRLIGGNEPHRRWLLKCPYHITKIEVLREVFPDACFVQTHRDPISAIPSCCSLLYMFIRGEVGESLQPDIFGPWVCGLWSKGLDRINLARQKSPGQFLDIDHRCLLADPLAAVRSIYDHFGFTLLAHTEERMRAWIAANASSKAGKHQYAKDCWGVTRGQICDTFSRYRTQHQFT